MLSFENTSSHEKKPGSNPAQLRKEEKYKCCHLVASGDIHPSKTFATCLCSDELHQNSTSTITKCITNLMCISDIDAYQYQYLKEKTHNNPPYQSIMSIQIRWYSPLNWRLCNISQLDELHQSSTSTPIPVLINYQVSTVMSTNTSSFQGHIETKLRSERSWFRKVNPNP